MTLAQLEITNLELAAMKAALDSELAELLAANARLSQEALRRAESESKAWEIANAAVMGKGAAEKHLALVIDQRDALREAARQLAEALEEAEKDCRDCNGMRVRVYPGTPLGHTEPCRRCTPWRAALELYRKATEWR